VKRRYGERTFYIGGRGEKVHLVKLAHAELVGDDNERGQEVDAALDERRVHDLAHVVLGELAAVLQ
jgi:hypothetical protein